MAYDVEVDSRIRRVIKTWGNSSSKKMFGGTCHLLNGNMFCGVYREFLILRLGEKGSAEALMNPFVKPMDITGKPMKGWVMVEKQGIENDEELSAWLEKARAFAMSLPSKTPPEG